ncbi:MAG TPA: D-alanyl-D-alanine carboxypeptidase, partial [Gaiellaceae bacterium]|nr:D-alanyl-D-alanine carboxypeptidase [Gaiellaceae bacterium]
AHLRGRDGPWPLTITTMLPTMDGSVPCRARVIAAVLLDRWTPAALVSLLRAMWDDPDVRPELLAALPVAGRTGTLAGRMRSGPARGVVRAKTGSTSNASALSGFVGDRDVFSVVQNGWPVATTSSELAQDRFAAMPASSPRAGRGGPAR